MRCKHFLFGFFLGIAIIGGSSNISFSSDLTDTTMDYTDGKEGDSVADPMEDLNRSIFAFNQDVDTYFLRPLSEVYDEGLPGPVKDSIHNFLGNLNVPLIFIHDVLQAEGEQAIDSLARFLINSTLGLGGLFDPAAELFDLQAHTSDFGQTLGKYGVGEGGYLMIPVLGPSTTRDFVGRIVDFIIDPFNYWARREHASYLAYTRTGVSGIDARANAKALWSRVNNAHDPYVTLRSIYKQNRDFMIQGDTVIGLDSPRPSEN